MRNWYLIYKHKNEVVFLYCFPNSCKQTSHKLSALCKPFAEETVSIHFYQLRALIPTWQRFRSPFLRGIDFVSKLKQTSQKSSSCCMGQASAISHCNSLTFMCQKPCCQDQISYLNWRSDFLSRLPQWHVRVMLSKVKLIVCIVRGILQRLTGFGIWLLASVQELCWGTSSPILEGHEEGLFYWKIQDGDLHSVVQKEGLWPRIAKVFAWYTAHARNNCQLQALFLV